MEAVRIPHFRQASKQLEELGSAQRTLDWKIQMERRTFIRRAFGRDDSVVVLDDLFYNRESDAATWILVLLVQSLEGFEDPPVILLGKANAIISDHDVMILVQTICANTRNVGAFD